MRLNPHPDLVVLLDAPGAVMFARKGEHSAEVLEGRRQGYLALAARFPHSVVLDASRPADQVRTAALTAIWRRYGGRR
jgi:thymidylate kinase